MIRTFGTIWLVGIAALSIQRPVSTESALQRLQAKIDVEAVANLGVPQVAGQFVNPSAEQNRRAPGLGKDILFLFPDRTYIYTFETDISPDVISDKGIWALDGDLVQLSSDKDVTWQSKNAERKYILVRRRGHSEEMFVVGLDRQLTFFEENAKEDPEFMFLLNSLKREQTISEAETVALKKRLKREKWRPNFYRK